MKKRNRIVVWLLTIVMVFSMMPGMAFAASGKAYVATGDVNLRTKADKKSEIVTVVKKDDKLNVSSTKNKHWYKVSYKKGKKTYKGYVSSKFLKKQSRKASKKKAGKKSEKTEKTYIATQDVNMREKADKESKVITVVKEKAKVKITDTSNKYWFKAVYKKGKKTYEGYISSAYLKEK